MASTLFQSQDGKEDYKVGQTITGNDGNKYTITGVGGDGGYSGNLVTNSRNSGGSSTSGGSTNKTVTTNSSYNGNYLTVNTGTDYNKLIQNAVSVGDYKSAALYEAQRNAKIDYMAANGYNTSGVGKTNRYIGEYTNSATGQKVNNNQGGTVYSSNNFGKNEVLNNGKVGTYYDNGATYRRNADGTIQQQVSANGWETVGTGVNKQTGEFSGLSSDQAKQKYLQQSGYDLSAYTNNGVTDYNKAYNEYSAKGMTDSKYVDALQNGTVGNYMQEIYSKLSIDDAKKLTSAIESYNSSDDVAKKESARQQIMNIESKAYRTVSEYDKANNIQSHSAKEQNKFEDATDWTTLRQYEGAWQGDSSYRNAWLKTAMGGE